MQKDRQLKKIQEWVHSSEKMNRGRLSTKWRTRVQTIKNDKDLIVAYWNERKLWGARNDQPNKKYRRIEEEKVAENKISFTKKKRDLSEDQERDGKINCMKNIKNN